ncbi:MAG: hypothetical protein HKN42_03060, partial [Granulosicoccus sp.]|nr:hypothetical protein [Granulosicoccus sp.]
EARRAEEAGVDEYLTKPLQLQSLKDALGRFLKPTDVNQLQTGAGELATCQESPGDPVVFDRSVLPVLVGDDAQAITECLDEYLDSLADIGLTLAQAIRSNDLTVVGQIVHRMKSSSLSVGAMEMQMLCLNLETICQQGGASFDESDAQRLELAMDRADTIIRMSINSVPQEDDVPGMQRCSGKGH